MLTISHSLFLLHPIAADLILVLVITCGHTALWL